MNSKILWICVAVIYCLCLQGCSEGFDSNFHTKVQDDDVIALLSLQYTVTSVERYNYGEWINVYLENPSCIVSWESEYADYFISVTAYEDGIKGESNATNYENVIQEIEQLKKGEW